MKLWMLLKGFKVELIDKKNIQKITIKGLLKNTLVKDTYLDIFDDINAAAYQGKTWTRVTVITEISMQVAAVYRLLDFKVELKEHTSIEDTLIISWENSYAS